MLLSRIKCLKTKESQLQAEVGDSTSSPAWPSPNVPAALCVCAPDTAPPSHPPHQAVFWAFKMPPTWTQWSWSAPPMPPAPLSPSTCSYPRSSQSPAPVPVHPFWHYVLNHHIILHNWLWSRAQKPDFSMNCSKGWTVTGTYLSSNTLAFFLLSHMYHPV